MKQIAILTPHFLSGDAIGNDVQGMRQALREAGHDARIFANEWKADEAAEVFPVAALNSFLAAPDAVLIYHFGIGWRPGLELLNSLRCKKVVKYHNITPPEFFAGYNDHYRQACQEGRAQIADVARSTCDVFLSDSAFNQGELIAEGAPADRCRVVAPFHAIDRLAFIEADAAVLDTLWTGPRFLLMVGRVAPNKGHHCLIESFATYRRFHDPDSILIVVGRHDDRLSAYTDELTMRRDELGLTDAVFFVGGVTETELKAFYLLADVFVIASEHEGFCVPLVESMAMKVPIVALGRTALPGTLGDAGIAIDEPDPYLFAEAINVVMNEVEPRRFFAERGARRYESEFRSDRIKATFLESLAGVL